jgi:hypothetical protein
MKIHPRSNAMKTHRNSTRSAILLLMVSLFFSAFAAGQAMGADPRSPHAAAPSQAPARLVIRRMPNLGFNVIVQLWIDGQQTATLGYGHTYHGVLTPGRHVLAVLATPRSRSPIPWEMPLNVQSGQTYIFTATGSPSGNLVLASGF